MSILLLWFLIVGIAGLKAWAMPAAIVAVSIAMCTLFVKALAACDADYVPGSNKLVAWLSGVAVVLSLTSYLLPNEKQTMLITGAYIVTNNQELAKLPGNLLGAANQFLEQIKTPEVVKE